MKVAWRQTRLLLWKDYLIRKRKLVTLGGVVWAALVISSLLIVRSNIDTQNVPTCQYAARALPSAGMLTFLQSFICSINNECLPMDQYEEIPLYQNSRLRKLEGQFSPLLSNQSILEVAAVMPNALKLVATFVDVIDEPEFHHIGRGGIRVSELFVSPARVKRYLSTRLGMREESADDFLRAEISLQGIFNASFDKCVPGSLAKFFVTKNAVSLEELARGLCRMSQEELEQLMTHLIPEINYKKYFKMLGNMLHKLNNNSWVGPVGDLLSAASRLMHLENFVPVELAPLLLNQGDQLLANNFTYYNFTIIKTFIGLFEPTFGDVATYRTVREMFDSLVDGVQWLYGALRKPVGTGSGKFSTLQEAVTMVFKGLKISRAQTNLTAQFDMLEANIKSGFNTLGALVNGSEISTTKVFNVLSKLTSSVVDILPPKTRHDVLYYSTLVTMLIEGAHQTVLMNVRMEEIMHNVSKRHLDGVGIVATLPPSVVGKLFDALLDAERTQIFTSKIATPGQMFCDSGKLQNFFKISKTEAETVKRQLCSEAWKSYVSDIVQTFGIFDVKNSINKMASLVVKETIGRDNSEYLFTMERNFNEIRMFADDMSRTTAPVNIDWMRLFNVTSDSELFRVVRDKMPLAKRILIVIHGALAREIVKQNPILEAKITPILIHATTLATSLNAELEAYPRTLTGNLSRLYPQIVTTTLRTLLDREKTYKALSTQDSEMLCSGAEQSSRYLNFPTDSDKKTVTDALCQLSVRFQNTLDGDSKFAKAIRSVMYDHLDPMKEIQWTTLISQIKKLYVVLETNFPFVFAPTSYNMDKGTIKLVGSMAEEAKAFWFDIKNLDSTMHLSISIGFKVMDILDKRLFNMTAELPAWSDAKRAIDAANSFLVVTNQMVRLVTAISDKDGSFDIPYLPMTVKALRKILPNVPEFIKDSVDIFVADNSNVTGIISLLNAKPAWPCSGGSMADILPISRPSKEAIEGLELVLCGGRDLQREWLEYAGAQRLRRAFSQRQNDTTDYEPYLFLKMSRNFDEFLNDLTRMERVLQNVTRANSTDDQFSITEAYSYLVKVVNDKNTDSALYRKFFTKVDLVLNAIDTSPVDDDRPVVAMWEEYLKCSNGTIVDDECRGLAWASWKFTLEFVSTAAHSVVEELSQYFTEVNEPDVNILQIMGFTKNTGLYTFYEKLPDFMGVLLNSYWDLGFMNQIRKASKSLFWDCESVVDSLVIPVASRVSAADVARVKPYVCPSVLYWISLPKDENTLLNVIAKTQYYFYTMKAKNLTSVFAPALDKSMEFTKLLNEISKKNISTAFNESIENKLNKVVADLITWNISEMDAAYRLFDEINKRQFVSALYLTKVATIVNNITESVSKFITTDITATESKDLAALLKIFKRRPSALLEIYFDVITEVLWRNSEDYKLTEAFDAMCANVDDSARDVLSDNKMVKKQLCARNYKFVHENVTSMDMGSSREVLLSFVQGLQKDARLEDVDMHKFFSDRKEVTDLLKLSVKYADDVGLPIYVQYLQSNLRHYDIVLSFAAGQDWWSQLRQLYSGRYANLFFSTVEDSFTVAEDIFTHLDKIRLVRILKDVNVNNTDMFCLDNLTLSDYVPDGTGALSNIKRELCNVDRTELFRELPPLLFASQGYDSDLKLNNEVNYTSIDADIRGVQEKLLLIRDGPKAPMRPSWITDDKLAHFQAVTLGLLSKEFRTKIFFGTVANLVDGFTLFLNNSSECGACSTLTTWLRQINLQLIKKDEYEALICHLKDDSLTNMYNALKGNFHWDMAIKELISQRNYTNLELNKALNQFLEHVSPLVLQTLTSHTTVLDDCLADGYGENVLGNLTFHLSRVTRAVTLLRSAIPHLEEIDGMKVNSLLVALSKAVAPRLPVTEPLERVLGNRTELNKLLEKFSGEKDVLDSFENAIVDISKVRHYKTLPLPQWITTSSGDLGEVCARVDCRDVAAAIVGHLDLTELSVKVSKLQTSEFWKFRWLSDMFVHVENFLTHAGHILGVASRLDVEAIFEGRMAALLDGVLTILQRDNVNALLSGLNGIIEELHPVLRDTELDFDLQSLSHGMKALANFRDTIIDGNNLTVDVWRIMATPERVESELGRLGINNTNFWSVAAPRIRAGRVDFKPLLSSKVKSIRVKTYVCQPHMMSQVILPADLGVVTSEDVYAAVGEQFCELTDRQVKQLVPVLMKNINFTYIMNKIADVLLLEVYRASNLSETEGNSVVSKYGQMLSLMPVIQENLSNVSDVMSKEPLLAAFRNAGSMKDLLSSSEFLSHAGDMLCGAPLLTDNNRFYKAIAETKDYTVEPDQRQLDTLPTEFCRSLYKEILGIGGGKIIWAFVKPLVMGKILYTPETPAVQRIMTQANASFARMSEMRDLVSGFAEAFDSVETLSNHKESLITIRGLMNSVRFEALRDSFTKGVSINGGAATSDLDFASLLDELGDVKSMGGLMRKLSDLLGCVNLNRFVPMRDELKLSNEAVKLTMVNEFSAGIVFNGAPDPPNNVDYTIRMDIESVPTTSRKRNQFWTPGPEGNFIENMRYFRGFVQIQDLIDKAIVEQARNTTRRREERDVDSSKSSSDWAVYTQQMPYPCYKRDVFQSSLYESQALIVAFFFSLILTVSSAVRFTVHERESGNTMLMSVMGLHISNHTLSWFVASLVEMLATTTAMFLVLQLGAVLPHSDPFLLWLLMVNFGFSVITFCYMLSKLFKSASLGAVCAAIAYLMTFLPYIIVLSMEAALTTAQKVFTSLSMSTGFCYSVLYVARYEAIGEGAHWDNAWRSPDSEDTMSVAATALVVLFDALLYSLIGWLIERFTEYKGRDNLSDSRTSREKAGISIVNVTKVYGAGRKQKVALDNVSIELHRGQITTLLGHNGAGKTTLIKIITGMLKPTRGTITVRTDDCAAAAGGAKLGVCPQSDVLIENMTSVEHLKFYAQLKSGKSYGDVELEVQSMLHALCFGGLAYEQVRRLSGGLRRRLCVALAFIARPQLVLLDEPSSGVDPVARRDIWSLIVKLKEGRTVLLTTHHLDEAELLSDQVVIMHKGQIHTTGSPIEIKRSLGNGYKLVVFYTRSCGKSDADTREILSLWSEESDKNSQPAIEELSKSLLTSVRSIVKNAQLVDVRGRELEVALPFFDADGLNNDFGGLCKLLEREQTELQFDSYSMDCSSLEQVFFNICHQADSTEGLRKGNVEREYDMDHPAGFTEFSSTSSSSSNDYKTASSNSLKTDNSVLVPDNGKLKGTPLQQYRALLQKRRTHYARNWWLLTLLFALPTVFMVVAMAFSLIRPPADNEVSLRLHPGLYGDSTEFLVPRPSVINGVADAALGESVMAALAEGKPVTQWKSNPHCECTSVRQQCDYQSYNGTRPAVLALPNASTLLDWATSTHDIYIEKRYGGWSAAAAADGAGGRTSLVAWYNNKGHHAMPSYVNGLNTALLRSVTRNARAAITARTHPLKISEEQLSKSTLLQHVADVGIAGVILIGFSLIPAGAAVYLVTERESQQKRLQLLCGVSPLTYWLAAVTWDVMIIVVNIGLTACVLACFGLPVFVERDNLPAICLLLLLFGFSCNGLVHVFEKLFTDASLANMMLFCLNVFVGVSGLAILLILDIISDSDVTDNARWTLHKIFMLSPQFALGDGLIEIAKNSIQAQVLKRFGMDTYDSPLSGGLITYHYVSLLLVGILMFVVNLAIESDWLVEYFSRWCSSPSDFKDESEMEDLEVATERYRVELAAMRTRAVARPTHMHTIGNINAGFVNTEDKKGSLKLDKSGSLKAIGADIVQCLSLRKEYAAISGTRTAVHSLTLGIPPGQCMALLGENGAGKSTTFGMLTGELRPTGGQIVLQETQVDPRDLCQGHISYCPQNDALDPLLTVREQLRFYCRLRGIGAENEVIRKTLETLELKKYARQSTATLSGGNKRKLCTAIALMSRAPLILLDEPTSGMDPGARGVVARGVRAACAAGRAVLLSTHALEDARRLAHRLALLQRGRLRTVARVQHSLARFGGGYVVGVRMSRGADASAVWEAARARLPRAELQAHHYCTLQFLIPFSSGNMAISDTKLSDIFREMASLQGQYDIEDYTVNQSSLYQMFANFSDKKEESASSVRPPTTDNLQRSPSEELLYVTSL